MTGSLLDMAGDVNEAVTLSCLVSMPCVNLLLMDPVFLIFQIQQTLCLLQVIHCYLVVSKFKFKQPSI